MKIRTELKLYLVILFFLYPNILWAKLVPAETARQVAVNHMNNGIQAKALQLQKGPLKPEFEPRAVRKMTKERITETFTGTKDEIIVYYVFNFSPEGWSIISADDVAYPVIGYCESGIYDPNILNQPPAFTAWMDNVAAEIADAVARSLQGLPDAVEAWKELDAPPDKFEPDLGKLAAAEMVMPLIKSTWGQKSSFMLVYCWPTENLSYNRYCPWKPWGWNCRNYCPTGCTATAMAQIMRYWQWPPFGQGSHGYNSGGWGRLEVDFSRRYYNWGAMRLHEACGSNARLMKDIGVAVEMNYKTDGSSAYVLPWYPNYPGACAYKAFQKYFRYNVSSYGWKNDYDPNDWIERLKAELDAGRPILYRGSGSGAHAFICDGYLWLFNSLYFTFNWGWEGNYDGGFRLDNLTPGGLWGWGEHDYTNNQGAIFGIEPNLNSGPNEVFVDDNYSSDGDNDGYVWHEDAFDSIQEALLVVHSGGTVYVAAGTYNEAINFQGKAIHLYGIEGPEFTTLSYKGDNCVVTCASGEDANTILEGFTISGGSIAVYGMCNSSSSSPTVTNCIFSNNNDISAICGMLNGHNSNPTVTNCTFSNNTAAGMQNISSSSPTVTNCTFSGNRAQGSLSGGGIYNVNSSPTVTNCILWGNTPNELFNYMSTPIVSYSDVQGGYTGTGNINADPRFVDPDTDDYHLLPGSPCINAGDPNYVAEPNETDLDGNPRVFGDRIDMGAYEAMVINVPPITCIVSGDRAVAAATDCAARVTLDGSCSSDEDSTEGTNDDINDFDWYEIIDVCDANSDIFLGSGEVIECNLGLGEHLIILEVTDKAGAFDSNEVVITVEDRGAPVITLNGSDTVVLECGLESYTEEGATASDNCDEDVRVAIGGDTVDTSTCGTYIITYDAADDSGNAAEQVTRMVTVNDTTGPVIALNGSDTAVLECGMDSYVEEGATATDNCEDDVAVVIGGDVVDTSSCGTYVVTYDATDSWGNEAEQIRREVIVQDTTGPAITLNGSGTVVLECGIDSYVEEGATATDNCDDDVAVVIGGDVVDTTMCGMYVVTYDATDDWGNAAEQVVREVIVEDTTPPAFSLSVEPNVLWPPNNKMVLVTPGWEVSDNCDESPEVSLVDITMSAEGDVNEYVEIGGDGSIYLRATKGQGRAARIYTLTYEAVDDSGNVAIDSATVTVPHDQRRHRHRYRERTGERNTEGL